MARQPRKAPEPTQDTFDHGQMAADMEKVNALALATSQANENAHAVAHQLGYDGALTVGALEDEIRFYQRRTAEACLELGKRLLILKELTPHGEFQQRVELLGIDLRLAQRLMKAAFKFSKSVNLPLLTDKIGSQSKLLELLAMDDDELIQLADGESVRGLTLDDIEIMTYSQLKTALREARQNEEATGRILTDKNAAIDNLAAKLMKKEQRVATLPPDDIARELRTEASVHAFMAEHTILNQLIPSFRALTEHALDNGGEHQEYMLGLVAQIELAILKVREDFGLSKSSPDSDPTPLWLRPGADAVMQKAADEWQAAQAGLAGQNGSGKAN